MRAERFELMARLAKLPDDMVFFTQITMEAAEDPEFLDAMRKAHIKGALVGVESVTPEGLKAVYKDFNLRRRRAGRRGCRRSASTACTCSARSSSACRPTARTTFDATAALAERAGLTFAQFVMLTPFPGTVDFDKWEKSHGETPPMVDGMPLTRHWLIPPPSGPKIYMPHPTMSPDEIRARTQGVWDRFYSLPLIWKRARVREVAQGAAWRSC